jgi:xanthine dehydrogenase YagS FAD-binding subunit
MNKITYTNATTLDEAVAALGPKAAVLAGGTDLLSGLKGMILPTAPEKVVDIKNIPGLDYIKEESGMLKIGATTRLADIADSSVVQTKYGSLAEAAHKVGGPQLRNMGTIGGNLAQEVRCWYYRAEHNAFNCLRKGGAVCVAVAGDNTHNCIVGGQGCFAICPSDTAIALTALNATVVTTKKNIPIADFFKVLGNALDDNEIIKEIQVPTPAAGTKQSFIKFAQRKAIDFAIASAAVVTTVSGGNVSDVRIVLGGVAPVPYRSTAAETFIKGKPINAANADATGAEAVKAAVALPYNKYKIQIAKTMVKRALMATA